MKTLIENEKRSRTLDTILLKPGKVKIYDEEKINIQTPFYVDNKNRIRYLNIPIVSAAMQSVASTQTAIELALQGGVSFVNSSRTIEEQVKIVEEVKMWRNGLKPIKYIVSISNIAKELEELQCFAKDEVIMVTEDGNRDGKFCGIVFSWEISHEKTISSNVQKLIHDAEVIFYREVVDLKKINNKSLNIIVIKNNKDEIIYYYKPQIQKYPNAMKSNKEELVVGAAINTWDYEKRLKELIKTGVDVFFC